MVDGPKKDAAPVTATIRVDQEKLDRLMRVAGELLVARIRNALQRITGDRTHRLLGVVGAILAIPMAAAVLLLMREVVIRKQNAS